MIFRALKLCLLVSTLFVSTGVLAEINILGSTPVGSWSLREDTTTDESGQKVVTEIRTSMLKKEERDGKTFYWMEMVADTYTLKNNKRKKSNDRMIIKTLVEESVLRGDPANAVNNLRSIGDEAIVQTGNEQPMRISGAGSMAEGLMQITGTQVNYDFKELGSESVTVPAGTFSAVKVEGSGSTQQKVLFRQISVSSQNTGYFSSKVPFGLVKAEGETTTNGKTVTNSTVLIEYGTSGATSQITGEPREMPAIPDMPGMPNIRGLFGGQR